MLFSKYLAPFVIFLLYFSPIPAAAIDDKDQKLPRDEIRTEIKSADIFDRIAETSSQVRDLSARVSFHLDIFNLGVNFKVKGNIYYKQPGKMKLKLNEIPDILETRQQDGFKTTNILAGLRKDITTAYDARVLNQSRFQGQDCYTIQLIPKTDKGISKILIWVDTRHFTMPQVIMHYADGSMLIQHKHYIQVENVYVVDKMETDYNSSGASAEITALFSDYQINKGLSDTLFEGKNQNPINNF